MPDINGVSKEAVRGDQRAPAKTAAKPSEPKKGMITINAKTKKGGGTQHIKVSVGKIVNQIGRYRPDQRPQP